MFPVGWVGSVTVSAVLRNHGAGDGAAAAVFNLNGRARLPGTAEGGGVVIRDRFCTQHALLVTRVVRQQNVGVALSTSFVLSITLVLVSPSPP